MKLIEQGFELIDVLDPMNMLQKIERAGRTCYKSEDKITQTSAEGFVQRILKSGHHSVIEHVNITVRFITNRGVTHELVRHRLAAYSQESTRYCNYGGDDIVYITPVWWNDTSPKQQQTFISQLEHAELTYKELLRAGWSPQQAREVLPNALKTEIVVTANVREWRHILTLRCSKAAHPQIRELMLPLLDCFSTRLPVLFDDIRDLYFFESRRSTGETCNE